MQPTKKLLVCDLDDTLYDWVGYFVRSFYAMADKVVEITGCDREVLLDDFRRVHRRHHNSEHPFSLLETKTVRLLFPGRSIDQIAAELDPAFHAFNSERKRALHLYDGVREGLDMLTRAGVVLVAHTESKLHGVVDRLTRLNLTHYFSRIYCRKRSNSIRPDPRRSNKWLETFPMEKVIELSHHQRKPDPTVLREILSDEGISKESAAYVGDSLARDILMAREAGVFAIWAKYGATHVAADYARLVRVSHWTAEDVKREKRSRERAAGIRPDWIAEQSFLEVVAAVCPAVALNDRQSADCA